MGQKAIDDHEAATITNEVDTLIKEVDNNSNNREGQGQQGQGFAHFLMHRAAT